MDVFMLEGWTPIFLIGIVIALIIFFISRKVTRKTLLIIPVIWSLVCFGIVIYSREVVGGWKGSGLLFVTISSFLGVWVGAISGFVFKK